MRERATNWINDRSDETEPRRRSGLLLAAASLPWVVVVALLVLPGRLGGVNGAAPADPDVTLRDIGAQPQTDAEAEALAAEPDMTEGIEDADNDAGPPGGAHSLPHTPPGAPGGTSTSPLELTEHRGRWRTEPGPEEAAALAVAIARAWLTGVGPALPVEGVSLDDDNRYAEHLVVEAIEQPGPEAAVVTVLAVVLEGDGDLHARVRRVAVPIAWEQGAPRPAGPPWWLPGPTLDPLMPATEPVDDPDEYLAVLDALAAAGLEDAEVHQLGRTSGWPLVAEVTARTAGGDRVSGPVWLRRHLDGFVVAGTTAGSSETPAGGGLEPEP